MIWLILILWFIRRPKNLVAVLGSGGHSMEMLQLMSVLQNVVFLSATKEKVPYRYIPRARKVKQSWLTTPFSFIFAFPFCLYHCFVLNPKICFVNGPGTCIPVCLSCMLLNLVLLNNTKIIYIESFARTQKLSLSAKIIYQLGGTVLVQWPKLKQKYPRTKYLGLLV